MTLIITENLRIIADKIVHNRKIEAIKDLRMVTNLGLKESKDIVDRAAWSVGNAMPNTKVIQDHMYRDLLREGFLFDDSAPATLDPSRGATEAWRNPSPYTSRTPADNLSDVLNARMNEMSYVLNGMLAEMREQTALLKDMMEVLSE